jgi:hypothetical protein
MSISSQPLSGSLSADGAIKELVSAGQRILSRFGIVGRREPEDLSICCPMRVGKPVLHLRIDVHLNGIAFCTRWSREIFASLRPCALVIPAYHDQQWKRSFLDLPERGTLWVIRKASLETEVLTVNDCGSASVRTKTPPVSTSEQIFWRSTIGPEPLAIKICRQGGAQWEFRRSRMQGWSRRRSP